MPEDGDIILVSKGSTFPDLAFNALLPLIVRGIPGINDCIHFFSFSSESCTTPSIVFVTTAFICTAFSELITVFPNSDSNALRAIPAIFPPRRA